MLNTISYLLSATLRMGTPIAYTALGGMTSERRPPARPASAPLMSRARNMF